MRYLLIISLTLFLFGCGAKATITTPTNKWIVESTDDDAVVKLKTAEGEIEADFRGRPGVIEQTLGAVVLNLPDVEAE